MSDWLHEIFRGRPWWMNVLMVFCAFMAIVYVPWDLFWKPVAEDQEVWFGVLFTGWAAKVTAPFHWIVYGAGAYGFRRRRPWLPLWGALYSAQVAFSMLVWNMAEWGFFMGLLVGLIPAALFTGLAYAFSTSREHFNAPRPNAREHYGEWALITGASAGIGTAFARALAREGVSCVLVARREDRLQSLSEELERDHGVKTRVVALDLTSAEGPDRLCEAVADLELGLLINNAGFGGVGRFDKLEESRLVEMVQLNCMVPLVLTRRFLPGMRERGRGGVIFTGSVSGRQPLPLHATYSATKVFEQHLGEALWVETRGTGIEVLVLEPGVTETEFQKAAGELEHEGDDPADVVEAALDALGQQPTFAFGWFNYLRATVAQRLGTRPLTAFVARSVMERQTPADML